MISCIPDIRLPHTQQVYSRISPLDFFTILNSTLVEMEEPGDDGGAGGSREEDGSDGGGPEGRVAVSKVEAPGIVALAPI